ncbi:MAG: uroporphyrinogen-III synthase [Thaumarchaeota archaeon]|nr:uroporphyrinogen-III synthase [Nitrososphaerota archaeon]
MTSQLIEARKLDYRNHSVAPLSGRTILITRSSGGNETERAKLETLGAEIEELEAIKIFDPSSWTRFDEAIREIEEFDWIVFTSANGVRGFFRRCSSQQVATEFLGKVRRGISLTPKFACVGPSTKITLEQEGYRSSFVPHDYTTRNLALELKESIHLEDKKILLARTEDANPEMCKILRAAGARVFEAAVYSTRPISQKLTFEVLDRLTDITLTSPSTVEGLLASVSTSEILSRKIQVHCIGPITARKAGDRGLFVHSIAEVHTLDGLIESMRNFLISQKSKR